MKTIYNIMIALCTVAVVATSSYSMDKEKKKEKKASRKAKVESTQNFKNNTANGNYKHQFPVSKNNKFKESFNKPAAKESVDRNYKHQGAITVVDPNAGNNTNTVKTTKTVKRTNSSYKHQYGL